MTRGASDPGGPGTPVPGPLVPGALVPGPLVLGVAAVAGAGTMTVELAAVRLLAPWFGTSLVVWTNVIGVVLLALALGYLLGGRLARGPRPVVSLGVSLVLGGVVTTLLPVLVGPVAGLTLPTSLALEEAADLVLWGSLFSALALFLLPAALLGTVPPLAVETVERGRSDHGHGSAGGAGGAVLCASTLGSLVGVFGTSHVFVPELGLRGTFLAAGLTLVGAGLAAVLAGRGGAARLFAGVVLGAGAAGALARVDTPVRLPAGWSLVDARQSAYQAVRVVDDPGWAADGSPMRHLQVNEAFDSYQSVWQATPGLLPEGFYYNLFALPFLWEPPEAGRTVRVQVLGLGAGTTWRVLEGALPEVDLDLVGVELDPVVVELAREHMQLAPDDERHRVVSGVDARVALRGEEPGSFDLIVLDCYANQVEIPPHLVTVEFFEEVRTRLAPNGWLAANLGGFSFGDPVVAAVQATCSEVFDQTLVVRVPQARNYVLFARAGGSLPLEPGPFGEDVLLGTPEWARWCFAPLGGPFAYARDVPAHAVVLTDDHNPIDLLQLESIRGARPGEEGDA